MGGEAENHPEGYDPEHGGKLVRRDVDDAVVHELDDRVKVLEGDVLQDDDGVLTWVDGEQGLKVVRTCREEHFVGLKLSSLGRQSHVDQFLVVEQARKSGHQVDGMVVPSKRKVLGHVGVGTGAATDIAGLR